MYIDAMVLRDTYSGGAIQAAQRIYYQHDANFNTTAIVGLASGTWQVTQRYIYDPYGNVTVLNPDWTTAALTGCNVAPPTGNLAGAQDFLRNAASPTMNEDYAPFV